LNYDFIKIYISGFGALIFGNSFLIHNYGPLITVIGLPPIVFFFYFIFLRGTGGFTEEDQLVAKKIDERLNVRLLSHIIN
jgi:hypothetical protein